MKTTVLALSAALVMLACGKVENSARVAGTASSQSAPEALLKSTEEDAVTVSFKKESVFDGFRSSWTVAQGLTINVVSPHFAVAGVSRAPICAPVLKAILVNKIIQNNSFTGTSETKSETLKVDLALTSERYARPCTYSGKLQKELTISENIYEISSIVTQTLSIWNTEKDLNNDSSWMHDPINHSHDFNLKLVDASN